MGLACIIILWIFISFRGRSFPSTGYRSIKSRASKPSIIYMRHMVPSQILCIACSASILYCMWWRIDYHLCWGRCSPSKLFLFYRASNFQPARLRMAFHRCFHPISQFLWGRLPGWWSLHIWRLTFDVAMEDGAVIIPACCEGKEVLACFWAQLAEKLDFDVPVGGLECQGHSIINTV